MTSYGHESPPSVADQVVADRLGGVDFGDGQNVRQDGRERGAGRAEAQVPRNLVVSGTQPLSFDGPTLRYHLGSLV